MAALANDPTLPTRDLDDSLDEHDNDASVGRFAGQNGQFSDVMEHEEEETHEGLFGSDSEQGETSKRRLDDEPDSLIDDADEEANEEEDYGGRAEGEVDHEVSIMDVELGRHNIPEPSDGEMYLFKIPPFLSFEPRTYDPEHFEPPTADPSRQLDSNDNFSPYNKAISTMRWRRSPNDPSKLESNARFIRWSDGSLTLQLATRPQNQYIVKASALAPPQRNPLKPTPTSVKDAKGPRRANNLEQESFTYLASPHQNAGLLRITNKFTTALKVQPLKGIADDSLDKLKSSLAAAAGANGAAEDEGISLVEVTEDPELAKKRAELAERDKQRAQRRREAQEMRDRDRSGRVLGRRGLGGPSGLTVGGLEDDEEMGSGAGKLPPVRRRAVPRGRRGEILSDDDDGYGRRGRTKEDEYDEEDDFVARSDEEEEIVESESDEDEGLGDFVAASGRGRAEEASIERQATPKREREDESSPSAPAGTEGSPTTRAKRRRIIEDDEDE